MSEAQDEFWRDISVVRRHIYFIVALLIVALLVAVGTGLIADTQSKSTSEATIDIEAVTPLSGRADTIPTLDTFREVAESAEVAAAAAAKLGVQASDVEERYSVTATEKEGDRLGRITITAKGSSGDDGRALAAAVMDAFVDAARGLRSDPQALEALREQESLTRRRLGEFDEAELAELAQVRSNLSTNRTLLTSLENDISAIGRALALIDTQSSRPLEELKVAISGLLGKGGNAGVESASTVAELKGGLELRRGLAENLIEDAQLATDALTEREQELAEATAGASEIRSLRSIATRNIEAANLAAIQTETEITVTKSGEDSSGGVNWLARLGAAAAFGLVAGIAGAFALEYLAPHWQRWLGRDTSSRPGAT